MYIGIEGRISELVVSIVATLNSKKS